MHKCRFVCIFASLYTLAQGGVHLALILWYKHTLFIKFHKCIYPDNITIYMFVYINYFYDNECLVWQYFMKQANHSSVVYEIDNVSPFELHKQPYTVLDVFWLITSILLFVAALSRRGGIAKMIFYIPWISMTFVINIFDIYEIFPFMLHLLKCETAQEWLQSIGVKNVHDIFNKEFPMIPPTIMFVIITRFFIFLLINSTFLYLVTKYYLDAVGKGPRIHENTPRINNANYNVFLQNFDTNCSSTASNESGDERRTNKRVHFAEGTKNASSPMCLASQNLVSFSEETPNSSGNNKEINKNLPWTYFPNDHSLILPKIQKTLITLEGTNHHQSTKF